MSNEGKVYTIADFPAQGLYGNALPDYDVKSFSSISQVCRLPKICFIGDAAVGKSTLVTNFKTGQYKESYNATIGTSFVPLHFILNSFTYKVALWDTAGAESQNSITKQFYHGSDIACICFALDSHVSFEHVTRWFDLFLENTDKAPAFFLIGCKSDLPSRVTDAEIEALCKKHSFEYFATSAKESRNIAELVKRLGFAGAALVSMQTDAVCAVEFSTPTTSAPTQSKKKDCC